MVDETLQNGWLRHQLQRARQQVAELPDWLLPEDSEERKRRMAGEQDEIARAAERLAVALGCEAGSEASDKAEAIMRQVLEVARLRAYRVMRIWEPNEEAYRAAVSVYEAAFGEHAQRYGGGLDKIATTQAVADTWREASIVADGEADLWRKAGAPQKAGAAALVAAVCRTRALEAEGIAKGLEDILAGRVTSREEIDQQLGIKPPKGMLQIGPGLYTVKESTSIFAQPASTSEVLKASAPDATEVSVSPEVYERSAGEEMANPPTFPTFQGESVGDAWTFVRYVRDTFAADEAQGFRSRDRQFAITLLTKAIELSDAPRTEGEQS